ncbi:TPA: AMP-binding protein [Serratia marcescens]
MAPLNDWPWRHWARTQPQATALMLGEQPLSWLALQSQVDELAADFQHQGVEPGCGVALCGKNSYPLLLAYLALLQCGARLLPLNPALPTPLLAQLLPELDMTFVFGPDSLPALPEDVIRLTPPSTEPRWPDLPTWDAQRLATLTLTSGSSGMPKAAAHSYANHLASAAGVLELMAFQREDCWLLSLPLFHVSGQGIVWRWLAAGARLAVREMHPLNEALAGCTHASLVPTQLWRLLAQPLADMTLKAVLLGGAMIEGELRILGRLDNLFFSGGEGVQPEDIERVLAAHPQITQAFVVPVADAEFGQRPVAVIDGDPSLSLATLLAWSQDKLANFQRPTALLPLPDELKNGGIKISRRRLQAWVAERLRQA